MRWVQEHSRRAVALVLIACLVIFAAAAIGGAMAGGEADTSTSAAARPAAGPGRLVGDLANERRRVGALRSKVRTQTGRVGQWRKRARRAEKALDRVRAKRKRKGRRKG